MEDNEIHLRDLKELFQNNEALSSFEYQIKKIMITTLN
jgi:hypothetical protein